MAQRHVWQLEVASKKGEEGGNHLFQKWGSDPDSEQFLFKLHSYPHLMTYNETNHKA